MSKIIWDDDGKHLYETGVNQGVLYPRASTGNDPYPQGYAWNGLTAVTESPSGAEQNPLYADDIKYLNLISAEELGGTIEAYTYPDAFAECDGSASIADGVLIGQQNRKTFGLSYRTTLGNDVEGNAYGYKLHIIYGASASPSERAYATINDSPEAITFSWEFSTVPVNVEGHKATANITIDSSKVDPVKLKILETVLYGVDAPDFDATKTYAVGDYCTHSETVYVCSTAITEAGEWDSSDWTAVTPAPGPRLPLPAEVKSIFS